MKIEGIKKYILWHYFKSISNISTISDAYSQDLSHGRSVLKFNSLFTSVNQVLNLAKLGSGFAISMIGG